MTKVAPKHNPASPLARVHQPPEAQPVYGRGRGGRPWRRKRERVMHRDGYLCQPCRRAERVTLATQCDHIIPEAEGGTSDEGNLQAICGPCHDSKTQAEALRGRTVPRRGWVNNSSRS